MEITKLFSEDRAVSPVIGVILMVAITVILAAVIGGFVLQLGSELGETAPQATYDWNFGDTDVSVTHETGDTLDRSTLSVSESLDGVDDTGTDGVSLTTEDDGEYSAGDVIVSGTYDSGETIRLIWTSPDNGDTAVLTKNTAP